VDIARAEEVGAALAGAAPLPAVDLLVNAAGVALVGDFLATEVEDWHWLLGANLLGMIVMCRALLPQMVQAGRGHIVNLASAAGYAHFPGLGAYGVTKAAVISLSEQLRQELRPRGVGVSVVCPGFVRTQIVRHARVRGLENETEARGQMERMLVRRGCRPEVVVRAILCAAERRRFLVPVTWEAHVLYWLGRVCPRLIPGLLRLRVGL
jgi:NAD(P)-dependent dehydrogenase (short-subunit alcohol dehydrogenase family)